MLFDVNVSLLVDADNYNDAEKRVGTFLSSRSNLDCDFLIHSTDFADEESLDALRK